MGGSHSLPHTLPTCPTLGSVSMSAGAAPPFDEPSDTSWPRDQNWSSAAHPKESGTSVGGLTMVWAKNCIKGMVCSQLRLPSEAFQRWQPRAWIIRLVRRITGKDPSSASIHWPCGGEYHDWLWREFTLKSMDVCLSYNLQPTNLDKPSRSVQIRLYEIVKNEVWILRVPIARFFLILLGPNQSLRLHEVLSAQLYDISPQHHKWDAPTHFSLSLSLSLSPCVKTAGGSSENPLIYYII